MKKSVFGKIRGDIYGGLTAGIIALPLALAFGEASGAGAAAGLYGAIALGLVAAIFGGTPTQISGPTGPMTVVTAAALTSFGGDFDTVLLVVMLAGLLQILFGMVRAGMLVRFMPYPVISGFMSGIGVIIILLQLNPMLGLPSAGSPLRALMQANASLAHMDFHSFILAVATMLIVFKTPPRISRIIPSPLIALLAVTLFSTMAGYSVATIGEIPTALPRLHLPSLHFDQATHILVLGITLAVLGSIDTLLTSLVADSLTKSRHDSNRELIGQGMGNMMAGLFGGLAGAGATMRTVINIKAGGGTRLSGVVHALFLFAVLLGLGRFAAHIPQAVLAGILIKVGVDILDYRLLRQLKNAPRTDLSIMFVVLGTTVFVDLIVAVGVGVVLSALMVTYRMARQTRLEIMGVAADDQVTMLTRQLQEETDFKIRIVNIDGPFFFGSTSQVLDNVDRMLGTRVLVFDCLDVPFMDLSAIFALEEMVRKLQDNRIAAVLAVSEATRGKLHGLGFGLLLGEENLVTTRQGAISRARALLPPTILDSPSAVGPSPERKLGVA